MRWIAGAFLAFLATLTAGPSFAFPKISTISSETLSTDPPRVRTTFTVQLVGYEPTTYWAFNVATGSGPLVQFFDCEAPVSWVCYAPGPLYPGPDVEFVPDNVPWPWPGILTFSIVTDQVNPCVDFDFYNGILSKTLRVNDDYLVHGCLIVDAPTPATPTSWGRMKAIYR